MIKYRIYGFEPARGILNVEYGEPGSGLTTPIEIFNHVPTTTALTKEVLHQICVKARPIRAIEMLRRIHTLADEEKNVISAVIDQEQEITDAEELGNPMKKTTIPKFDTSKK